MLKSEILSQKIVENEDEISRLENINIDEEIDSRLKDIRAKIEADIKTEIDLKLCACKNKNDILKELLHISLSDDADSTVNVAVEQNENVQQGEEYGVY